MNDTINEKINAMNASFKKFNRCIQKKNQKFKNRIFIK